MTIHPIAAVSAVGLSLSVAVVTAAGLLLGTGTGTAAVVEPLAETVDASAAQGPPVFRAGDASIPHCGRRLHYF